jgi:imidazolonepropionase-like amidohydrolase
MMHRAGVRILAGTDFTDWGQVPGIDLHNELALFVEAGFTPLEALQTATVNPAKWLGRAEMFGTIQPGRAADMVILNMNPIEDISHTRKINAVVLRGRYYPLSALMASALNSASAK